MHKRPEPEAETNRHGDSLYLWSHSSMDHETAVRLQAAERYLLDEFSPEERREFEDHFFGCPACADEVRAGSIFAANVKSVLGEEYAQKAAAKRPPGSRMRLFWPLLVSSALNLALVAVIAFENYGAGGRPAEAVQAQFYRSSGMPAPSRGDLTPRLVPQGASFFGVRFDLTPGQHFDNFTYQILDTSGAIRAQGALRAPADAASELELA